ncbi:hypothetical protein LTR95_010644 [Oleoguttula sp. CCFEE 5521]
MTTPTPYNGWRSKRLIFLAPEPYHEDFLHAMSQDWTSFTNAAPMLPTPNGTDGAKDFRTWLQKAMLGVVICLPGEDAASEAAPAEPSAPELPPGGPAVRNPAASAVPTLNAKHTPIGTLTLTGSPENMSRMSRHRRVDIGINVSSAYQGQGYGSEAILWSLEFAFKHAGMHRVGIGAMSYNTGAVRLYERLGFKPEGRIRDFFWHDGEFWDAVELGMLEGEWWERYGGRGKRGVMAKEDAEGGAEKS